MSSIDRDKDLKINGTFGQAKQDALAPEQIADFEHRYAVVLKRQAELDETHPDDSIECAAELAMLMRELSPRDPVGRRRWLDWLKQEFPRRFGSDPVELHRDSSAPS